ncbi:MAG: hypothetical protein WD872_17370 [Pirellulaceae bacterium]
MLYLAPQDRNDERRLAGEARERLAIAEAMPADNERKRRWPISPSGTSIPQNGSPPGNTPAT